MPVRASLGMNDDGAAAETSALEAEPPDPDPDPDVDPDPGVSLAPAFPRVPRPCDSENSPVSRGMRLI